METREHDEHIGNSNQRNQILSKTASLFVAYRFRFIEMKARQLWQEVVFVAVDCFDSGWAYFDLRSAGG